MDFYVFYLALAFLVLLAMHEQSRAVDKTVPKLSIALTLLAFIMFYAASFFPVLDIVPLKGGGRGNLLAFIGGGSGFLAFVGWKGNIVGTFDEETNEK